MNVASPELSKELYELGGWGDTDAYWYGSSEESGGYYVRDTETPESLVPAYDLGYLLRKLPHHVKGLGGFSLQGIKNASSWTYTYGVGKPYSQNADTPEDAACKLAIELFKKGVL